MRSQNSAGMKVRGGVISYDTEDGRKNRRGEQGDSDCECK